jgi:hypothetical protein
MDETLLFVHCHLDDNYLLDIAGSGNDGYTKVMICVCCFMFSTLLEMAKERVRKGGEGKLRMDGW